MPQVDIPKDEYLSIWDCICVGVGFWFLILFIPGVFHADLTSIVIIGIIAFGSKFYVKKIKTAFSYPHMRWRLVLILAIAIPYIWIALPNSIQLLRDVF